MKNGVKLIIPSIAVVFMAVVLPNEKPPPEFRTIISISKAFGLYERVHEGTIATNWSQIGEWIQLDRMNQREVGAGRTAIQARYVFVRDAIGLGVTNSRIVMIRAQPLSRSESKRGEAGRYLIYRSDTGYHCHWMSEEGVRGIFGKAGVVIPVPNPADIPVVELEDHDAVARQVMWDDFKEILGLHPGDSSTTQWPRRLVVLAALIVVIVGIIMLLRRRRSQAASK